MTYIVDKKVDNLFFKKNFEMLAGKVKILMTASNWFQHFL